MRRLPGGDRVSASIRENGFHRGGEAAFLEGLFDLRRRRFFHVVGHDQGVILRGFKLHNAVYRFEDRTYPRSCPSGIAPGDREPHGLFRGQGRLLHTREPRKQRHQQDGQNDCFSSHVLLLRAFQIVDDASRFILSIEGEGKDLLKHLQ
jgi:hypothetical protein